MRVATGHFGFVENGSADAKTTIRQFQCGGEMRSELVPGTSLEVPAIVQLLRNTADQWCETSTDTTTDVPSPVLLILRTGSRCDSKQRNQYRAAKRRMRKGKFSSPAHSIKH